MTRKEYNGWTNYETWVVKLWVDNDEATQSYWQGEAEGALRSATGNERFSAQERAAFDLADQLKQEHEELLPKLEGFPADLLNAALSEVNWDEIAESLIADAKESAAA